MTNPPTLLILAAGMATRYGSLKQIDQLGPHGETIIDYSIYDAIKAGFGKVIFIIRESIEEEFKAVMLHKFSDKIAVDYILQELKNLPEGFSVPEQREKPWGTGQAVWVAASEIQEPFAVINGDDFYGYQSFKIMADFLKNVKSDKEYGLVGYQLKNTLSEHGTVSRGICEIDHSGYLKSVTEHTDIIKTEEGITTRNNEKHEILNANEVVSMNLMGFTPSIFPFFEEYFKKFLQIHGNKTKTEFYLPEVVNQLVKGNKAQVKVLPSLEKWFGVTYPNDKPVAIQNLKKLTAAGIYSKNLWGTTITHS